MKTGLDAADAIELPPPPPKHPSERLFKRGLRISLVAHAAVMLIVVLKSIILPGKPVFFAPTLRVDIVGLPDVLKKDLGKITRAAGTTQETAATAGKRKAKETADPDELVFKASKDREKDAKKREKKLKNALARIKALDKIADEKPKAGYMVKGNRLSGGTSLSGEARESMRASYYDTVRDQLQDNWALPVWVARQQFSAQVQINIDSRGKVRSYKFLKLSGNVQFDDAVKRAISESQPFPAPPQELLESLLFDGILVGFPL
ncbi:MAG: hypothetical protein A2583_16135 [Bdellovibrionales bacterium RIFOXYD1_FULL_53_11]|nr:MAG: hypothetical protein A2583_16135 [Bdellovibrionales bacterium RIFOXYD1_FULL_53_11]